VTVSLVPITRENWRASLEIRVQPSKLHWVASREPVALMLLAKSYIRPDGQIWHPFLVSSDDAYVGVLGVGIDERDAQTAWLHHVLIDERHQGSGLGRAAMLAVGRWLRASHPTVRVVGLCVLPENVAALGLYTSLGFQNAGETTDGQRILLAWAAELAAP
jgi:diamine N-acetyltransferase